MHEAGELLLDRRDDARMAVADVVDGDAAGAIDHAAARDVPHLVETALVRFAAKPKSVRKPNAVSREATPAKRKSGES